MKKWVPLLKIFLSSPTPEVDASLYFKQQNSPNTASFLSLLLTPVPCSASQSSLIFIHKLPPFVQSRILSFLLIESSCFSCHHLHSLAIKILNSNNSSVDHTGFWVHRAACNLLNVVSEDEFHALPDFLQSRTVGSSSLLSWLPISSTQITKNTDLSSVVSLDEFKSEEAIIIEQEEVDSYSPVSTCLDSRTSERAVALKSEILAAVSASEAIHIAKEIRKLSLDCGSQNELELLGLIEPWVADDETLSVILTNFISDGGFSSSDWPGHVICSIILPKLMNIKSPASRVLLSSTLSLCKLYPVAAVEALLFPLAFHKKGINIVLCDILTRIIKECLHRTHVSSFCQKLLSREKMDRRVVCLPCHHEFISDELVWNEPLFSLFQNILNQDVYLTPDCVDEIVSVIDKVADKFSNSLKFGNFFLCFVAKCTQAAKLYKVVLEKAAENTDTFVTKSILLKLGGR